MSEYRTILPEEIFSNREIHSYIECGNNCLGAIGFTEHGLSLIHI